MGYRGSMGINNGARLGALPGWREATQEICLSLSRPSPQGIPPWCVLGFSCPRFGELILERIP